MRPGPLSLVVLAIAVVLGWVVLGRDRSPPPLLPMAAPSPIIPSAAAPIDAALARGLFTARTGDQATAPDAPVVAGIVGRLPDDVAVLVRRDEGGTRTLGVGDTVAGWRLVSVAADAVLFERGDRRVRVALPAGDEPQ